ncbi:MAG: signal peptidase I [Dehalococcoidia bacterium]
MRKVLQLRKYKLGLAGVLLLAMAYLGLLLFTSTSSPFLLVRGNSMEPAYHAGDLLLNKGSSPAEIKVGDVIAFDVPPDEQKRLGLPASAVHRVIGIEAEKGQLVFVTKGDNSDIDPFKVPSSAVRGVVVKNLGPIGRPILFLTNRSVLLLLGLPILTFVIIVLATLWLVPSDRKEKPAPGATTPPVQFNTALETLAGAVAEYGVHLKSHTGAVKNLGETSQDLKRAVRRQSHNSSHLSLAVQRQNEVLADLQEVVSDLKGQVGGNGGARKTQRAPNGARRSTNGDGSKRAASRGPSPAGVKSGAAAPSSFTDGGVLDPGGSVRGMNPTSFQVQRIINEKPAQLEEAEDFLMGMMGNGPVAVTTIMKAAKVSGISEKTLRRAKNRLCFVARRESVGNQGAGHWVWELPRDSHKA